MSEGHNCCGSHKEHDWRAAKSWYGDSNVVNGTVTFTVWTCRRCGEETHDQPEDWEPMPERGYDPGEERIEREIQREYGSDE